MRRKEVTVYGAGMSGLIAAYNLAREGHDVLVRERETTFGGSSMFNPSTHVTPLDLEATSAYIGIDVSPAFHAVESISLYLHDLRIPLPAAGSYAVERSSRLSSLDALLYEKCLGAEVEFEFERDLVRDELGDLPPGTIIACGLNPEAYDLLGIPYITWYGWMSRGEADRSGYAWIWLDECINEYGYISYCNGLYYDLVFSYGREVDAECLQRYREFMRGAEDTDHAEWEYVSGAVPLAAPDNPRLLRDGLIMCGTISGAMDPFMGFGISGALVSGKVAAMAVEDTTAAEEEFARFTRNFASVHRFKHEVWYGLRSRVDLLEELAAVLGPQRSLRLIAEGIRKGRKGSAIPGFSPVSCS
ncbi:MAG: FAD-dependent oxidoreductase [Actinobacteria bacterium]|nr:MAG: FAD-dependent oxidoreductase [Actinomycetota bacterium]